MKTTIVRYRVKADRAEENTQYIQRVFEELDESKPDGVRYVSFNLDDGVSFVHIAVVETPDGNNPLTETAAFKEFTAKIRDRCDDPPLATTANIVGSYRLFWEKYVDA